MQEFLGFWRYFNLPSFSFGHNEPFYFKLLTERGYIDYMQVRKKYKMNNRWRTFLTKHKEDIFTSVIELSDEELKHQFDVIIRK